MKHHTLPNRARLIIRSDHQITQIEMVARFRLLFWVPKKPATTTIAKKRAAGSWNRNWVLRFLKNDAMASC
ncbi:hypothetical protein MNV_1250024 [Candidatus Methanoperedens nitroreducens]|uniref:Uncharacterized protein n=1 Tax=Candidatus Methanoperedens nitratireducens TaxID=1392998 RepID=A0A284VK36_9EURY|nr:hypothetical protein MNV_1250024 [Candidatus Methanoperedens nitroreducens]